MADPLNDVLAWLNMTPQAPRMLTPQDRDAHISRLVPFQPRVPLDAELAAEQADREEAQRRQAEWLEWRRDNYSAGDPREANKMWGGQSATDQGVMSDDAGMIGATLWGYQNPTKPR